MSRTPVEGSSSSFKMVSGTSLRISPNLEALLQHDELTRGVCHGSPTSLSHPESGFAFSLPPPPPRNNTTKKAFPSTPEPRVNMKEIRRKRSVNVRSDSWPDALPDAFFHGRTGTPVHGGGVSSSSAASSRCATPNPFINPTPSINNTTSDPREAVRAYARSSEFALPPARRSEPDVRRPPPMTIPPSHPPSSSHRSSPTLYKVEKMFTRGRESLSILTSAAIPSGLKLKQDDLFDPRARRTEFAELRPNQLSPSTPRVRQDGGLANRASMSHQWFTAGDTATAAGSNVSPMTPRTQQQLSPAPAPSSSSTRPDSGAISPSISSTRSLSFESGISPVMHSGPPSAYYTSSLPHLSPMSPLEMPPLQQRSSDDQQSFIDFYSPPSPFFRETQDVISTLSARRPSAPAILPSSINSITSYNSPLDDLPSMVFAPPSPTNEHPSSPPYSRPSSSLSTHSDVSVMIFAPGSPTSGPPLSPTYHSYSPGSSQSSASSVGTPEPAPPSPACRDTIATLKPPIPTSAKPLFERRDRKVRLQKRSVSASPQPPSTRLKAPLPPTINKLHATERADLIRRNRKLVQLLGQTPGAQIGASEAEEPRLFKMLPQPAFSTFLGSRHNHRHAMSVSVALKTPGLKTEPSSPWQVLDYLPSNGRRHSTPYTPKGFTFYLNDSLNPRDTHDHDGSHSHRNSATSFIDLSDEEVPHDASDVISVETTDGRRNHLSSTPSLVESLSPEEQAEAEKRRKRDKLAKLHRFLGSRVPTDLVVGHIPGPSLPPASLPEDGRDMWLYRRRMSGASAPAFERVKDELDVEEKALNVRRAQKMEKLFGTPPPQTLYHTRHVPATGAHSQPTSPVSSVMVPHYLSDDDPGILRRNPNQSAYMKGKRTHRPRSSESTTFLLPFKPTNSPESSVSHLTPPSVYMNYQHSIASLTDIIERDDRESLAELHRFLHGDPGESPTEEQPLPTTHRLSSSSYSYKSERRHSLPTRTSMTSISTDIMPPPKPEASDFQLRRRRAAKLMNFFGVDYRELIHDILESIEKGVEEERKRGTLRPEEVELLLHKLHDLRMRRDGFL